MNKHPASSLLRFPLLFSTQCLLYLCRYSKLLYLLFRSVVYLGRYSGDTGYRKNAHVSPKEFAVSSSCCICCIPQTNLLYPTVSGDGTFPDVVLFVYFFPLPVQAVPPIEVDQEPLAQQYLVGEPEYPVLHVPVAVVSGLEAGQVAWPVAVSRGHTIVPEGVAEAVVVEGPGATE